MSARSAIRGVLLAAATLTGLAWFAVWAGIHGWFPGLQRELLLAAANRYAPFDVEVEAVGGSLVDGFVLEGFALAPRNGEAGAHEPPLTARRIEVAVDLSEVYERRQLRLTHLVLEGVNVRVEQDASGGWQLDGLPFAPGNANPDEPWRVSIDELKIRDGRFSGSLPDVDGVQARGNLVARDLAWPDRQEPGLWSSVAGELVSLRGRFGQLRLRSGRLHFAGSSEQLDLRLEHTSLAAGKRGRLHAQGTARVDLTGQAPAIEGFEGRLAFSELDVSGLASPLEGVAIPVTRLNGEIDVDRKRDWQVDFTLDRSIVDELTVENARGHLDYSPESGVWRLEPTQIAAVQSAVTARGHGTFEQIEALEIDGFELPIGPFATAFGIETPLAGAFHLTARLSGPPTDPRGRVALDGSVAVDSRPALGVRLDLGLRGDGVYSLEQLDLAGDAPLEIDFTSSAPARIVHEHDTWRVEHLALAGPRGGIDIERLRSDGTHLEVEATFDELDLAAVTRYATPESVVEGRLSGPARFDSSGNHPRLVGDLVLDAPRYRDFAVDRIAVSSQSNDSLWSFAARVEWGEIHPIEVDATIPYDAIGGGFASLARRPETHVVVRMDEIQAQRLEAVLSPFTDATDLFDGSITGRFELQGEASGPQIAGAAAWSNARFGSARADNVALTCRTEEGILRMDLGISDAGRSGFAAEAEVDLARWIAHPEALLRDPAHHASLRAEDIDLGWLIPRASTRRLGRVKAVLGRATGEIDIRGSADGPRINGRLRVRDGELRLALVDEPIGPIQASLLFDNDELEVERIKIGSKKGAIFVRGHYRWPSGDVADEVDLNANFKKFALTHFPLLDAQVDGDLDLTGSLAALDAQGDLTFSRVQVNLPEPEDPLFREVRILGLETPDAGAGEGEARSEPSAYQTMQAQIALDVRPGARIRERGADLQAEGQVLLRKKRLSPTVLQGTLQTTGGTYTFLGRTFDVAEGVVTFEERIPPDPDLRIVATRQVGDVTVGVRRTGTWSNPSSQLFSEPEMDDSEILSYLVLGRPQSEIGAADNARVNALAAQLAGNLALAEISRALASELPINEISVEMADDMTVASVGVETSVGEDIILRYDRALQEGAGDRFTVEWRFWKDFSLRSEYTDGGASGLDLFWSYEY